MYWGSQWPPPPLGRKPTWLFLGAAAPGGSLPGFFWAPWGGLLASLARGEDFCGGNPPGFLGRRTGFLGRSPNPPRISPPGNPVLSRRHDFLESSA